MMQRLFSGNAMGVFKSMQLLSNQPRSASCHLSGHAVGLPGSERVQAFVMRDHGPACRPEPVLRRGARKSVFVFPTRWERDTKTDNCYLYWSDERL